MLDTVGGTRGTDMNETATLQGTSYTQFRFIPIFGSSYYVILLRSAIFLVTQQRTELATFLLKVPDP